MSRFVKGPNNSWKRAPPPQPTSAPRAVQVNKKSAPVTIHGECDVDIADVYGAAALEVVASDYSHSPSGAVEWRLGVIVTPIDDSCEILGLQLPVKRVRGSASARATGARVSFASSPTHGAVRLRDLVSGSNKVELVLRYNAAPLGLLGL